MRPTSVLASELCEFFDYKKRLKLYLTQPEDQHDLSTAAELLKSNKKWENYPSFYRGIKEELAQLNSIHQKLKNSSPPQTLTTLPSPTHTTFPSSPQEYHPSPSSSSITAAAKQLTSPRIITPQPTSTTIHNFFRSQGIVGEETTQEILIYGALARANIGIESLSGSGKSAIIYALLQALPPESYQIIDQATGKSLYNNPNINRTEFWVVPELQKIFSQDIEEIIKNLTEGISTTYTKTNRNKDGIDTLTIQKKSVIYAFAITNKHLKNRDEEFYRRFIILPTDISKEQNKRIALNFAQREFEDDNQLNSQTVLPAHIKSCLEYNGKVKNPFLEYILSSLPEEISTQLRFRSSLKYLQSLTKGCTLFYTTPSQRQNKTIFTTISAAQKILELYQPILINNIFNLNVIDQALLSLTPAEETSVQELLTTSFEPPLLQTLHTQFYEHYPNINLEESIEKLLQQGLLYKKNNALFHKSIPKITLDPEKALPQASELMLQHFPEEYDSWYAQCVTKLTAGADNE